MSTSEGRHAAGRTGIRRIRRDRGMSQLDLAREAGVSRQAVAGIEAGSWDPSLKVALAMARALGTTVEALFEDAEAPAPLEAIPLGGPSPLRDPWPALPHRVELAQVGTRTVALPLGAGNGVRTGFSAAHGVVTGHGPTGGTWAVAPVRPLRRALVVAGCDPALPLLGDLLSSMDPPTAMCWWPTTSRHALSLLAQGMVHLAGVHLEEGAPLADLLHAAGLPAVEVIGFASWDEGLALRPSLTLSGVHELAERRLRVVNREPGSEARSLFDRNLAGAHVPAPSLAGHDSTVRGHLAVAAAVASGLGDVGVTTEPSAVAHGLGFIPLAAERSVLVATASSMEEHALTAAVEALRSPQLRRQLGALAGYRSVGVCGAGVGPG